MTLKKRTGKGRGGPNEFFLSVKTKKGYLYHDWYPVTGDKTLGTVGLVDLPECVCGIPTLRDRMTRIGEEKGFKDLYEAMTRPLNNIFKKVGEEPSKLTLDKIEEENHFYQWVGLMKQWPAGSLWRDAL